MSFKKGNIYKNSLLQEISSLRENEIENENEEEYEINHINNYNINNNNLTSRLGNQYKPNRAKGDTDDVEKLAFDTESRGENIDNENIKNENNSANGNNYEEEGQGEDSSNKKETQYYELNTNKIVDMIKNDYDDIYMKQNEDINKFVENLAKENSTLKLEINQLNSELIKLKIEKDFIRKAFNTFYNDKEDAKNNKSFNINKQVEINLEKNEKEKEIIKKEYESILLNNTSSFILKDIKSLYDKLIRAKDELYNYQKINILLQEENDKIKEENKFIKSNILEERNKIIKKIIEIQASANSEIELNKNLLFFNENNGANSKINISLLNNNKSEEEENTNETFFNSNNNNIYSFYIEKIKNLTYEKNKLLSCNYDFFTKINDLSQALEEKNNTVNTQSQKIGDLESQILILQHENSTINLKYNECMNMINELQNKNSELIKKDIDSIKVEEKIKENKNIINKRQYESKIIELSKSLNNANIKYEKLKKEFDQLKEQLDLTKNSTKLFKSDKEKLMNEKNKLVKEINKVKTDLKLQKEEMVYNNRENETKIKLIYDKFDKEFKNKNRDKIDYIQVQSSINDIYNNVVAKNTFFNNKYSTYNSNINISMFISSNSNDLAKLNEIKKQLNLLYNIQQKYVIMNDEFEKMKNHINEIINITLENATSSFVQKYKEDTINISMEQLILKIIDYIKVIKVCSLLQKIKTIINFSEKYMNWLNDKEYFKTNNASIQEIKNEINDINREIDDIKNIIKSNTLNIEKKFKNFLSKDEVKNELNNIRTKYENIISGIFEYFLKYKNKNGINNYKNQEFLILEIPIKSYNLMIENNMNNISSIGESIESWNLYVNDELDNNNDSIFQEIINLTNINNLSDLNEYNNISDLVNNESVVNLINKNANNSITTSNNYAYNENNNENDNENNNEEDNENDNEDNNEDINDNDNETESNKNETQTNPPQENKYQYSFDNQQ